jgi:hypothetical protein
MTVFLEEKGSLSSIFLRQGLYVAQAGLELEILMSQPPRRWDYRHVPPYLASICSFWRKCPSNTQG